MADGLWNGADVRWVGPTRRDGDVTLRRGDRAVVVDAGRHHLGSFSVLAFPDQRRHRSRGVVVRVESGGEVRVSPRHLELVPPDHPLQPEPDARVADWWLEQLDRWGREGMPVSTFVPRSFPAVRRLLHPWRGQDGTPVTWVEAAELHGVATTAELAEIAYGTNRGDSSGHDVVELGNPRDGELDQAPAEALVDALEQETSTPDDAFVAVWVGWGDIPTERFPGAAVLDTQSRGHFLLRGPLTGVLNSVSAISRRDEATSGIWWPADRSWFVATEIDFPWTFVAGRHQLAERLDQHPDLEVTPAAHDDPANRL